MTDNPVRRIFESVMASHLASDAAWDEAMEEAVGEAADNGMQGILEAADKLKKNGVSSPLQSVGRHEGGAPVRPSNQPTHKTRGATSARGGAASKGGGSEGGRDPGTPSTGGRGRSGNRSNQKPNTPKLESFMSSVGTSALNGPDLSDPIDSKQIDELSMKSSRFELQLEDQGEKIRELEELVAKLELSQGHLLEQNQALMKTVRGLTIRLDTKDPRPARSVALGSNTEIAPRAHNPPGETSSATQRSAAETASVGGGNEAASPLVVAGRSGRKKPVY